jgi:hypothetical protein
MATLVAQQQSRCRAAERVDTCAYEMIEDFHDVVLGNQGVGEMYEDICQELLSRWRQGRPRRDTAAAVARVGHG